MKLWEVVGDQVGEAFPDLPVEFMNSVFGLLRGHGSSLFDEMSFSGGSSSLRAFLEVKKFFGVLMPWGRFFLRSSSLRVFLSEESFSGFLIS